MSAPFINRRVKVTGTSKVELNGQTGRAQSYSASSMRYTVVLDSGPSVALKPANLLPEAEDDGGSGGGLPGMPAGMPDMSQVMNMLPPWLKEKLQRGQTPDLSDLLRLLPPGVTLRHVAVVVVLFVMMLFKFGLMKTVLLFTVLGGLVYAGFGAFMRAGGGITGLKAAVEATGQQVAGKVSTMSQYQLQLSPTMALGVVGAVVFAVLYFVLFTGGSLSHSPSYQGYASRGGSLSLEQAYLLGHADGLGGEGADWARHAPPLDDYDDYIPSRQEHYSSGGGIANLFSFGKLFTLGILGKQIYGLGSHPGGGGWNMDLALANFMNMGAVQKGFMALMVLRLFGMSPI